MTRLCLLVYLLLNLYLPNVQTQPRHFLASAGVPYSRTIPLITIFTFDIN